MTIHRRQFLAASAALAGCGPELAKPFNGYAYLASQTARTVSVVSLSTFKLTRQIPMDAEPTQVLTGPAAQQVFVLTPSNGTIVQIDGRTGAIARKYRLAASADTMRMSPDGASIWMLARDPPALIELDLKTQKPGKTIRLSPSADGFDLSAAAAFAVVGSSLINLASGRVERELEIAGEPGPIRFRPDGKHVIAAHTAARLISIADVATGRLLVKLPLALEPERFCFTLDNGGQLFVTGRGADAVVIVSPYQTAVGETILAGRAPGNMAVDDNNLYVANPSTGDLVVIAIVDRRVVAKITVGQEPIEILLTPDGQFALVVNKQSSDLAVIRLSKLADFRFKRAPLFTVIPVGANPVSGAICKLV